MIDLLAVVGPTAAGKTALGVALAERLGGEVVSADAYAVYRGMDIGTAKPTAAERRRVPHHLVDVADPHERYSAGAFVRDADAAIAAIRGRGRLPVVVGGTLFYVRALLRGLFPEPLKDAELRRRLEEDWRRDPDSVHARLRLADPESARRIAPSDRQRILRAIEVAEVAGRPMSDLWRDQPSRGPRYAALLLGLVPARDVLRARIALRVESMFVAGLLDEVAGLLESGVDPEAHAMKAIGYRECCRVLSGEWTVAQAQEAAAVATRRLAKRQMTWLRGETGVVWLGGEGQAALAEAFARLEGCGGTGTTGPV